LPEEEQEFVSVYPNPVASFATVDLEKLNSYKSLTAKLYNSSGLLINDNLFSFTQQDSKADQLLKLDFSDYATGSYTITIKADDKEISKNIVIAKEN